MSVVCDVVLLTCFKLAALLCVASKAARGKRGAHCWVFVNHLLLKTSPSVRIIMDSDDDGIEMPVWSVSGGLTVDGEESMEEFLDREFQDLVCIDIIFCAFLCFCIMFCIQTCLPVEL
eukprot:m.140740 g.140740  ORF g.140740 m.140740 type:complete len:118 (-) comp14034_c0_seq18:7924-8277(-)